MSNVTISGNTISVQLDTAARYGESYVVDYNKGSSPVTDLTGKEAASFTGKPVRSGGGVTANWYGVRWLLDQADPDGERVASSVSAMDLHASLPVQSAMKGCVVADSGTVNYYLKADDWTKKADGSASNLDGTDGQVMIEVPEHYFRVWSDATHQYMAVSLSDFSGSTKMSRHYVGAYEAALNRTNSKLASVQNLSADYRGGNNDATKDAQDNTLLGRPATVISLINFRTYARNRGAKWNVLPYQHYMAIYRLFMIEYATRNSQKPVDLTFTVDGFRKGGLGNGVTTLNAADWNTYSGGYYPIIPCGITNVLGNHSGEVEYVTPNFPGTSGIVKVPAYRGIENPFGHIWKYLDGINIYNDHTAGTFSAYLIDNPANFASDTQENARFAGFMPTASGWLQGLNKDMIVESVGGAGSGSSTYFCDNYYSGANDTSDFYRVVLAGGHAYLGASAGFAFVHSYYAASIASAFLGSRLCFLP